MSGSGVRPAGLWASPAQAVSSLLPGHPEAVPCFQSTCPHSTDTPALRSPAQRHTHAWQSLENSYRPGMATWATGGWTSFTKKVTCCLLPYLLPPVSNQGDKELQSLPSSLEDLLTFWLCLCSSGPGGAWVRAGPG